MSFRAIFSNGAALGGRVLLRGLLGSARSTLARRERPRHGRAAEQRDELAALHSITSSARSRIDEGSVIPISFAVLKFATSWNRVGRSAGNSATFAPCRTLRAVAPT